MTGTIRALRARDLPQLIALCREHAEYERAPWSDRDREGGLADLLLGPHARGRCWIAEGEGDELAGFAVACLELSTWDAASYLNLDCLYLRERYRGAGLGHRLMQEVAAHAQRTGAVELRWLTPAWNEDAARFYRRLGATATDKLRFFLGADRCAALATDVSSGAPDRTATSADGWHPRTVDALGTLETGPWRVKVYGIQTGPGTLEDAWLAPVTALAEREFAAIDRGGDAHVGLGVLTLHRGDEANWALVDAWLTGGKLAHEIFRAPLEQPDAWTRSPERGPKICVWELAVLDYERRAFVEHMFVAGNEPDPGAYLRKRFSGTC